VPARLFHNPRAKPQGAFYPAPLAACLDADGFAAAEAEIAAWPGYAPTPLLELPRLAEALGIGRLFLKDEAWRFGLDSFKALGGAYAVFRLLVARIRAAGAGEATAVDLAAGRYDAVTRRVTVACATDGNHGRSVAWGAQLFHCRCVVFIHAGVSEGRAAAMARYGAEVVRVAGSYDDSVRHAARMAAENGWTVVSDTAYPGYTEIPRDVMHGYGVVAGELFAQLSDGRPPSHVFLQAGVGGFAAALAARFWQRWGAARPRIVVVEPERAACLHASALAGGPVARVGDIEKVMAGHSCGEPTLLAWPIRDAAAQDFMTIADERAVGTVRLLADGAAGDAPLVTGETGVAGLAGLRAAAAEPAAFQALGLGPGSRVLVVSSEGATDPAIYRQIAGRSAEEVRGG
jgi:diaminopropionate ammonia-lyase